MSDFLSTISSINEEFEIDENCLDCLSNEQILELYQKQIKSNSIKTILNHFTDFMLQDGDQIVIESLNSDSETKKISQIRKEFQQFMKNKKFNQRSFLSIFKSQRFKNHFEYYLYYYSSDIILSKKKLDNFSNKVVIHFFRRCFSIPQLINSMKLYKKNKER